MRGPVTKLRAAQLFVFALAAASALYAQADAQPPARGGGAGRGGRGGPLSPEDQAALAKLAELPPWKPGAGVGDYSLAPPYTPAPETVRADGGMTANRWFMQRLADILQKPVESASMAETTALGAAYIAGQAIGFYGDDTELAAHRASVTTFLPEMSASESAERHAGWLQAVSKVRSEVQG